MKDMKDDQLLMKKFVKIVEGYPEIYDNSLDGYRTRHAELAWEKIADDVRRELNEECTVEELKVKWKGIRSSFNRYKNKLLGLNTGACKKYYLYDHLQFLEPFTRPKLITNQDQSDTRIFEDCCNYTEANHNDSSNEYNPLDDWEADVKPDVTNKESKVDILEFSSPSRNPSKDSSQTDKKSRSEEDDNEDLQFFKSILPDIKSFTTKEKRKLKMGILQLIDDVENDRKRHKTDE
ncbi:uncharacterized protein LOC115456426 isoform X2 [Manduca sexta]|uniref:MADF domain-containing protein n=2 Tax=Manduca sexta TaxID=7130 RepID=A0A921YSY1_MANSE|nr:uncharacterized protein LOC115456426 isoform X2 [Manduca sexta]XP_030041344.1 uncharacterized protein LOC115456426 isoform X2 [Manduca sexta]KAG6444204.1 hypothetical protein O3G_MSEX003249 [Manduca sexta]